MGLKFQKCFRKSARISIRRMFHQIDIKNGQRKIFCEFFWPKMFFSNKKQVLSSLNSQCHYFGTTAALLQNVDCKNQPDLNWNLTTMWNNHPDLQTLHIGGALDGFVQMYQKKNLCKEMFCLLVSRSYGQEYFNWRLTFVHVNLATGSPKSRSPWWTGSTECPSLAGMKLFSSQKDFSISLLQLKNDLQNCRSHYYNLFYFKFL